MRYVIRLSFAALAVWVLQATGILMACMMFLMIGTVPGTHINISPTYMLILLSATSIAVVYWLFRLRPVRQIQELKRAYHEQADKATAVIIVAQKREPLFKSGLTEGYSQTRASMQRRKSRAMASLRRTFGHFGKALTRIAAPLRTIVLAFGAIIVVAAHEIATWVRPHIRTVAKWLYRQAGYSLKGTMLSAHKWSSLSKKLFSSLTSLLKRCSSVLKRGKSLLMRSAR